MKNLVVVAVLVFLASYSTVSAAQFCVSGAGISPQCLYDDADTCIKSADPPNTYCSVNPDAVLNYSGNSRYCAVSSNQAVECIYIDRNQCNQEAQRRRGVCIDRVGMNDKHNPYRSDPRVQY
jgi:hypothetical protein